MYGSGLGGVVKLKVKYPAQNGLSYRLNGTYGSFETLKYGGEFGYKKNRFSILAGGSRSSSEGFRQNNRYERNQVFLHARNEGDKNVLTLHLLATGLFAEIPSSLHETDYLESPRSAASNWLNINGFEEYKNVTGSAGWKHSFNENWESNTIVFGAFRDPYESRPFNILDEISNTGGMRNFIQFNSEKFKSSAGFELFREKYNWKIFETNSGETGEMQLHNSEIRQYGNLFFHSSWNMIPKLHLETGVNLNVLRYALETIYHIDSEDQSGAYTYSPVFSPRLGINYAVGSNVFLHASAGHGFSAPSLEETLLPEGLINQELLPEEGWNLDLGFRGWGLDNHWYYDVSTYTIYIKNMLVTERVSEEIFTGINAGRAVLSGLELFSRVDIGPDREKEAWNNTVQTSIFLNRNKFTEFTNDDQDYGGNFLPGIPAQVIHARIISSFRNWLKGMAEIHYSGRQYMNDANSRTYEGHFLVNSRISVMVESKQFPGGIGFHAGIRNIFNTNYASMILVNAPSFGGSQPRYFYPGMPRNVFISIAFYNR